MAVEVYIHKMSEHMETARIVRWLADEGDHVEQYQVIMEVETDKVVADFEAPAAGILKGIRPGAVAGAEVPVGETIAFVAAADEAVLALPPLGTTERAAAPAVPLTAGPLRASPVARRVARELGVDLGSVTGTGPEGRITEEDVRRFVASSAVAAEEAGEWLELTPAQRVMGERMLESVRTAPQFALTLSVDMTEALRRRESLMEPIVAESGERLSITALVVKAVAQALRSHPRANARFEGGRIHLCPEISVGVAVERAGGLLVPVIRDADRKSLGQINRELAAFQHQGEAMRFGTAELTGGTFTISNLGMYGIERFTAIINPPQSAILAVGRVTKTVVSLSDDTVGLRPVMTLTLTADHRVLDGVQAARLLTEVKAKLESGISE